MDPVIPFDWHRMFVGNQPMLFYVEILFRTAFMFLWALILIRYMGRRGSRNMSPMENLVIIALGSSTGDAMFYPDVPLTYAMVVVALVVLMSRGLADLQLKSIKVNTFTDGLPLILIYNGHILEESCAKARLRRDELLGQLRIMGHEDTNRLSLVFMERSGELSAFEYPPGMQVSGASTWPERIANPTVLGHADSFDEVSKDAPLEATKVMPALEP